MTSRANTNIVQARFLADIAILQQETAPVTLELGAVINGTVESGVISVKRAPQKVAARLVSIAESLGVTFSIIDGGVRFDFRNANELTKEEFFG